MIRHAILLMTVLTAHTQVCAGELPASPPQVLSEEPFPTRAEVDERQQRSIRYRKVGQEFVGIGGTFTGIGLALGVASVVVLASDDSIDGRVIAMGGGLLTTAFISTGVPFIIIGRHHMGLANRIDDEASPRRPRPLGISAAPIIQRDGGGLGVFGRF